jgi:hypothetical protein
MKHANAAMVYAVGQIIDITLVSSGCVASETLRHNAYRPKPPGQGPLGWTGEVIATQAIPAGLSRRKHQMLTVTPNDRRPTALLW